MGLNISGAFKGAAKGLNQGMDLVSFMNDLQELEYKRGKRAKKDAAQDEYKNFLKGKKYKVDGQSELLIPDSPEEKKAKPFSFVKPAETGEPLSGVDRPTGAEALRKQAELFGDGTAYAKAEEMQRADSERETEMGARTDIYDDLKTRSAWLRSKGPAYEPWAERADHLKALAEGGGTSARELRKDFDKIMDDVGDYQKEQLRLKTMWGSGGRESPKVKAARDLADNERAKAHKLMSEARTYLTGRDLLGRQFQPDPVRGNAAEKAAKEHMERAAFYEAQITKLTGLKNYDDRPEIDVPPPSLDDAATDEGFSTLQEAPPSQARGRADASLAMPWQRHVSDEESAKYGGAYRAISKVGSRIMDDAKTFGRSFSLIPPTPGYAKQAGEPVYSGEVNARAAGHKAGDIVRIIGIGKVRLD